MKKSPLGEVAAILPPGLADSLKELTADSLPLVEELRLRRGFPMTAVILDQEHPLGKRPITESDLRSVLEGASQASAHTVLEQVKNGFVTLRGGHRMGLCGSVSRREGGIAAMRYLSSLSIRIAHAVEGQAADLLPDLIGEGQFLSTLVIGAPGSGKTTLLRELIHILSDGCGITPQRVSVVDERGEIAAMWNGEAQFYVGRQTDILDGCPKAEGMALMLRAMNPNILAVDEITHPADVAAIIEAAGCGTELLATAHGRSLADLRRRPIYRTLLDEHVFQRAVILTHDKGRRSAEVEVIQ